jgi:hypothetical protein
MFPLHKKKKGNRPEEMGGMAKVSPKLNKKNNINSFFLKIIFDSISSLLYISGLKLGYQGPIPSFAGCSPHGSSQGVRIQHLQLSQAGFAYW